MEEIKPEDIALVVSSDIRNSGPLYSILEHML
jgi:hypothetical protein